MHVTNTNTKAILEQAKKCVKKKYSCKKRRNNKRYTCTYIHTHKQLTGSAPGYAQLVTHSSGRGT